MTVADQPEPVAYALKDSQTTATGRQPPNLAHLNGMILVTGGTGFIGQEVVRELLALGYRVRLLVRNPRRAQAWAGHPQVELVPGDALKPETLPAALAGVETVIHLIGIIAETSKITFEQAHTEATRNVLTAAQQAGVIRWIQMSAIGTRPHASSRYHLTKWRAEELVRQGGLAWTIIRPSLVYGYDRRDRILNLLRLLLSPPVNLLLLKSFPLLDGGHNLIQPVSVREVARSFAHAVAQEISIGQTYDLVGPVAFSWRELIQKVATHLGQKTTCEDFPILLILRALLWLGILALPIGLILGFGTHHLSLIPALLGAGLWLLLLIVAFLWRQVIIFAVPSAPLRLFAQILNVIAPRALQMSEQLKMATENNTGDPHPAMTAFTYIPETFDQALHNLK